MTSEPMSSKAPSYRTAIWHEIVALSTENPVITVVQRPLRKATVKMSCSARTSSKLAKRIMTTVHKHMVDMHIGASTCITPDVADTLRKNGWQGFLQHPNAIINAQYNPLRPRVTHSTSFLYSPSHVYLYLHHTHIAASESWEPQADWLTEADVGFSRNFQLLRVMHPEYSVLDDFV